MTMHIPCTLYSDSYPDHVVYTVDVTVPHVDPDGTQREAILLARALDGDG